MATLAAVKKRALQLLGISRIGQGYQTQDDTRIGTAYTEVYADLKEEGIATWAESGTIPNKVTPHLVALMAENAMDEYGISDKRAARIMRRFTVAKREIRALVTNDYESLEEASDY